MRFLAFVAFLLAVLYSAWPYYNVYRLDRALRLNDAQALASLVDLAAIRQARKMEFGDAVAGTANPRGSSGWQQGTVVTNGPQRPAVDLDWVRQALRPKGVPEGRKYPSILSYVSYAFFQSPSRFLVRLGDPRENAADVLLSRQDWQWRVIAISD